MSGIFYQSLSYSFYTTPLYTLSPILNMTPKRSQIVLPASSGTPPTRQSSRVTRKDSAATDVLVAPARRAEPQTLVSRRKRDEDTNIVIQKGSQQSSRALYDGPPDQIVESLEEEDADRPEEGQGSQSQSKVCH
jgi:hypothetical protein